jgi:iron complex outermembrane receptor protein
MELKMGKNRILQHAVRAVLATAAASAAVPVAFSQTASTAVAAGGNNELAEVIVTGSRLQTANLVSISPITTVTALQIEQTGLTRVEDILNNMPSVFAGQGSTMSNGADGTATVDLHDLGPVRTLVLINGRRLMPGNTTGGNAADINQIPAALIEKVDLLTGGASATYGADAVAGVVNFVMNTHYEGVKIDAQYGMYNHNNHSDQYQNIVTAGGYPAPTGTTNAGFDKTVSIIMGSNFADGAGNATMYATYDNQAPAIGAGYDYSACTLAAKSKAGGAVCSGSGTDAGGTLLAYSSNGNILTDNINKNTGIVAPRVAGDLYNFGALNYWERPNERWTAGGFINIDLNQHLNAYMEIMYMRNQSTSQVAPSGDFGNNTLGLDCGPVGPGLSGNPLISAQQRSVLCAPGPTGLLAQQGQPAGGVLSYYLLRRNVEGGNRQTEYDNDDWRTVIGVKGDFLEAFKYNAYAQVGINDRVTHDLNYFSTTNLLNAESPVTNASGQIVCATGGPSCVPYNFWTPGGVTQAALNYLTIPLQTSGSAREYVVHADMSADLGKFGAQIPMAKSGIQVNIGAEYRSESTVDTPDLPSEEGLGAGGVGDQLPIAGNFHVSEAFIEVNVPIADNLPGIDQLAFNTGYRYSKYTLGFTTNTYKFGLEYAPIKDIRFRGSFNQSVRAPNIGELFAAQTIGPNGSVDPCWGPTPALTPAQCALTGVTAAQYGHLGANPANQFNEQLGGNPQLSPEIAHTWTYGFVFQPTFLPSFYSSIDYYDIRITDAIEAQSGVSIILNCALTGNAADCADIRRNANGSLWLSTNGFVVSGNQNTGIVETKGVDLAMHYGLNLNALGKMTFDLVGTDTIDRIQQPNVSVVNAATGGLVSGPSYNCAGYFGVTCGNPLPRWRSTFSADWATPWQGLDFNLRWRYIGDTQTDALSQSPLLSSPTTVTPGYSRIPSFSYIDLSAAVSVMPNVTVRVGANNVLDKDPPVILQANCPVGACNNNSFGQVYDPIGRFLYVHLTAKF